MKILTWNIEWASARTSRGKRILAKIEDADPDVICFTEVTLGMIPAKGYAIESDPDYGYPNRGVRRKVVLWSKQPWEDADSLGNKDLPGGRFVTGITAGIRFVGICIPWFAAHVTTGRKDRTNWQDHFQYLDTLKPLADSYGNGNIPVCITGDFNQRIPRSRQSQEAAHRLEVAFNAGYKFATAGLRDEEGKLLIDHVATYGRIVAQVDKIIPKRSASKAPLSDHVGIITNLLLCWSVGKTF